MVAPPLPDNLEKAEAIAKRLGLEQDTVYKKFSKLGPSEGRFKSKHAVWYHWPTLRRHLFPQEISEDQPAAKPLPAKAQDDGPTRRDALNLLQADLRRLEGKIDTLIRAVSATIRDGKKENATAGNNKRFRRA